MSFDRTREFLLSLPRVEETLQWDAVVFWVLDKAVGGRMFAVVDPEPGQPHVASFAVPPEAYHNLLELDGVKPAPYLARAHWVAIESWSVFPERELHGYLRGAYERVESKLARRTQRMLELNDRDYRALVRERRAALKATPAKRA